LSPANLSIRGKRKTKEEWLRGRKKREEAGRADYGREEIKFATAKQKIDRLREEGD